MGTSSVLGFFVAPLLTTPKPLLENPKFETTSSGPDYIEKFQAGDPAAISFNLG